MTQVAPLRPNDDKDIVRILLIGDEPNLLRTLRRNLLGRGYDVLIALDDVEAYETSESQAPDLFVLNLDFTSVNVDGLQICAELRRKSQSPIIVLSAVGSEGIKIRAFDLGADDYVVMPFGMDEFLARVRSTLRRWSAYKAGVVNHAHVILSGDLLINTDSRQVTVRGDVVRLTPHEYSVLLYLAQHAGKVVTHRELLKAVWGDQYGDEREYLRVFVSQVRRKIEEDPLRPSYILTEPGVGYRFAQGQSS
ncbi:MAG TPA: response regulator transcription factor [Anaerolineales bacterium]|nr:response regulator transcription factor [Anaerolineales bacterium]